MEKDLKDDDLIIELEDDLDDGAPSPPEEVADEDRRIHDSFALPDGEGDDNDEPDAGDDAVDPRGQRAPEIEDDRHEREAQYEARERQAQEREAAAMWREAKAEAEAARQQRAMADISLQFTNERLRDALNTLARAKDNGDSNAEIAAMEAIDELKGLRSKIEQARASYPDPDRLLAEGREKAIAHAERPIESRGVEVGANIRARNKVAATWANQNASWMKTNAKANEFVIRESQQMVQSGTWDANSPGFYVELGRRVKGAFPQVKVANLQAPKGAAPQRRQAPVAAARPTASGAGISTPSRNAKRYTLTAAEQQTMKRFNLDPKNKAHQRYWAKSRIDSARRVSDQ